MNPIENFDTQKLLKQVIHTVVSKAPYGVGGIVNVVIDELFFPKEEVDYWGKVQKKVQSSIQDYVKEQVGRSAFNRVMGNLNGLANAFRQYANVQNWEEQKMRLSMLLNMAELTVAGVAAVPEPYLHLVTRPLQIIAAAHIAVLGEQIAINPGRYEYQMQMNNTAIMYSDMAGSLFERFLQYRMKAIAEGNGVIQQYETDEKWVGLGEKKKVRFVAYDLFNDWREKAPPGMQFLWHTSDWVLKNQTDPKYEEALQEAQRLLAAYGKQEEKKVVDYWNANLLETTQQFMQLVDWPGVNGERKPEDRTGFKLFPRVHVRPAHSQATVLDRLDVFLQQQMDQFVISGPRYVQTYRLPGQVRFGEHANIFFRADTYDTAMACIYFQERGLLDRARDLADGLVTAMEHDPIGGGRIVAATHATGLIDKNEGYSTSIYHPEGGTRDVGNMTWTGIALTRLYAATGHARYLYAAEVIGQWVLSETAMSDDWGGFRGGYDHWGNKREWRSVEHNVDAYAFFANMFNLTGQTVWKEASESARRLVMACLVHESYYVTGTGTTMVLNAGVVPTDTQSWTALTGLNPEVNSRSLDYMVQAMQVESDGYLGFKFAQAGSGIQNEATAGAMMALWLDTPQHRTQAERFYDSIARQIGEHPRGDGYGVLATPDEVADTGEGLGWKYYSWLHVASSAWTGLAFLVRDNPQSNPYAPVKKA